MGNALFGHADSGGRATVWVGGGHSRVRLDRTPDVTGNIRRVNSSRQPGRPGRSRDARDARGHPGPHKISPAQPPTPKIHQGCPVPVRVREQDRTRADHARAGRTIAATRESAMETPANDPTPTPAQRALDVLAENTEDTAALNALANSDVLIPVPDDANDSDAANPSAVALPVLEQPGGEPVVPVFTSEVAPRSPRRTVAGRRPVAHHRRQLGAPPDTHLGGSAHPAGALGGRPTRSGPGRLSAQRPGQGCPL